MGHNPVTVIVWLYIKHGKEEEAKQVIKYMLDTVIQEKTCRNLIAHQDANNKYRFVLYEQWENHDEFLNVQLKRPYRLEFAERMNHIRAEPTKICIYQEFYGQDRGILYFLC